MHFRTGKLQEDKCLDDMILKSYLSNIDLRLVDGNVVLIDRLNCIKNLVNRAEFDLTERQSVQIHVKFKEFCTTRKDLLFEEKKKARMDKVMEEENAKYYPIPKVQALQDRNRKLNQAEYKSQSPTRNRAGP